RSNLQAGEALSRQRVAEAGLHQDSHVDRGGCGIREALKFFLAIDYFFEWDASKLCGASPLTGDLRESILQLHEYVLPDDVLSMYAQRCVLHDTHLWPEEFLDLRFS